MEKPLTEKDWGELQNVLHGRDSKWQAIGIQLHVPHDELTRIKEEHGQNLEECNREMQIAWLKSGRATWRALVAALGAGPGPVGLLEDAKRLEEKHLGVGVIQSAASARGSHSDLVQYNSENLVVNSDQVQKSLLNEQLEWLVKMGFTVEDIMEWAQQAQKKRLCDDEGTFNNSSTNNNNDNSSSTFCANSESPQEPNNSDSTMLTSSTHAHTEPPRLQETPPTLSPPPPVLSDPLRSLSTPMDRGEALTPSGAGRKTLRKGCPRKRVNSSQGKQPKAKRGRPSKAALSKGEASLSRGREAFLRSPLRLSVEKGRQKAIMLLKEEMMEVLDEIEQHPAAKEFIEPVDRRRATNYDNIIAEPMCLANMATKVFEGIYKTPKMFCDDFNLIISNCEAYNGAESVYMQQARQLEAEFYNLVNVYFDDSEIDVQRHLSKTTTPPRGPTTYSPGAGGKGTPKTPKATGDDGSSGSLAADVIIQDNEREETPASDQDNGISEVSNCCVTMLYSGGVEGGGSGLEEMETGGQLPRPCTGMTPGSSGDETAGDSEDDLPSFRNIFSTPSKI